MRYGIRWRASFCAFWDACTAGAALQRAIRTSYSRIVFHSKEQHISHRTGGWNPRVRGQELGEQIDTIGTWLTSGLGRNPLCPLAIAWAAARLGPDLHSLSRSDLSNEEAEGEDEAERRASRRRACSRTLHAMAMKGGSPRSRGQ